MRQFLSLDLFFQEFTRPPREIISFAIGGNGLALITLLDLILVTVNSSRSTNISSPFETNDVIPRQVINGKPLTISLLKKQEQKTVL